MKKITFLFLLITFNFYSQLKGKITDVNQQPLSFVSVYIDGTVTGTTSNDAGDYVLPIQKTGTYTIVYQFLGYITEKRTVTIDKFPYQLDVVLKEEQIQLNEITFSTKENPALQIIRNAIASREKNTNKTSTYTAQFYSRGLYKIKDAPEQFLGRALGDFGGGLDSTRSGIIYLSETISQIKFQKKPKNFTEKIIASKVSGRDNGISFNRAEDANINFYENSVEFGNKLVSPISANAFSYYNYKLIGTFYDKQGKLINKISVLPKRDNDAVFKGAIYIVENDWALYGVDVTVTGASINIPVVDILHLKQDYNYVDAKNAWVLIQQTIDFKVNFLGFKVDGRFSSAYSDYNFDPNFTASTFTNEILSFDENATEKDTDYWSTKRPVPLTEEEVKDYQVKDSIKTIRESKEYLDSINQKQNQYKWHSPIMGYTYRNSYEKWSIDFKGLITDFSFNTVQGYNAALGATYFKRLNDKGKWFNLGGSVSYSLAENRWRPIVYFNKRWNNISRPQLQISAGITTPQLNEREPILKLSNTISSLFSRQNYLKIYEKQFANVSYYQEVSNGIYLNSSLEIATRRALLNNTDFSFAKPGKKLYTSNNPLEPFNFSSKPFADHTVGIAKIGATFIFNQKYYSYPDRKFNVGNSKYPTLYVEYKKVFGAKNNDYNNDALLARINQTIDFGNFGTSRYNVRGGMFLQKKNIAFMDNFQAIGNELIFPLDNNASGFGLLPYYQFFTNDKYAEGHFEHNFGGSVLGKIPLLNKLNLHLITGAKTLMMANQYPYSEFYIGLDNIGFGKWRFLRVDYVKSYHAGITNDGFLLRFNLLNR